MPCDSNGGPPTIKDGDNDCNVVYYGKDCTVHWPNPHACPGGGGKSAAWKLPFVILFFVGGALYITGGVYYNFKKKGVPLGIEAIPNINFWRELPGLVNDGVRFFLSNCNKVLRSCFGARYEKFQDQILAHAPASMFVNKDQDT